MWTPKCLQNIAIGKSEAKPLSCNRAEDAENGLHNGMQQEALFWLCEGENGVGVSKNIFAMQKIERIEIGVPKYALTM